MKRIDVYYGGQHYSISGRDYEDVQHEILGAVSAGPSWLRVNIGEGRNVAADLLITPGVLLSLVPIEDPAIDDPANGDHTIDD
ncbi:hypothetical protein [Agromyces sp. NPDC058064]|uniref:hypothetical protein n=1 Tax=Agromyces sp. NPDC058064 TaxID=3346322 RepID=UPI0036DE01FB